MTKKRVIFVIDQEQARDILEWWTQQKNKSAAIRDLIRKDLKQDSVTLQDICRAVIALEQKLEWGQVSVIATSDADLVSDEPADVAAALESLGLCSLKQWQYGH